MKRWLAQFIAVWFIERGLVLLIGLLGVLLAVAVLWWFL